MLSGPLAQAFSLRIKYLLSLQAICFLPNTYLPCLLHLTTLMPLVLGKKLSRAGPLSAAPLLPRLLSLNMQFKMHIKSQEQLLSKGDILLGGSA